jgi:NTP pyrophosphatase (non-canonical NTP hydrolase)
MNLKQIIKRNYKATVKRGLITPTTNFNDFYLKIVEETEELNLSKLPFTKDDWWDKTELADIILVCLAMAEHYKIDIEKVLEEKVKYNEQRKD